MLVVQTVFSSGFRNQKKKLQFKDFKGKDCQKEKLKEFPPTQLTRRVYHTQLPALRIVFVLFALQL